MTSLKAFFEHAPIHTVNVGLVQDYMSWRRTEHAVREVTLRHDLHALSGLFHYAEDHWWVFINPVASKKIKIPSDQDAVRFHRITPAEETAYLTTTRQLLLHHLHDIARVMLLQGPRPSEVMALHISDLQGDTLIIRKGKSNAAKRTLHLTPEAKIILEARADGSGPDGWLFPGKKKGMHATDVQHAHEEVLEAAKLAFVLYDFRHNFATRFAEVTNGDVVALAAILGHANLRTVMRYVHPSEEHKRSAMAKYAAHLEAQKQATEETPAPKRLM